MVENTLKHYMLRVKLAKENQEALEKRYKYKPNTRYYYANHLKYEKEIEGYGRKIQALGKGGNIWIIQGQKLTEVKGKELMQYIKVSIFFHNITEDDLEIMLKHQYSEVQVESMTEHTPGVLISLE